MPKTVAPLWQHMPADIDDRLRQGGSLASVGKVFFRADDIGAPGSGFSQLLDTFARHDAPLALAVVPTWLTPQRWRVIRQTSVRKPHLWCWHQHGWRHWNHELDGKKQEFGPARELAAIESDITRGRKRLCTIMGDTFQPIFTPPWNRCDHRTLTVLAKNKFSAVSRSAGRKPSGHLPLPDIPIAVDLHTRKGKNGKADWPAMLSELAYGLALPVCGIMIHHQRMNSAAFDFLDILLGLLSARDGLVSLDRLIARP